MKHIELPLSYFLMLSDFINIMKLSLLILTTRTNEFKEADVLQKKKTFILICLIWVRGPK